MNGAKTHKILLVEDDPNFGMVLRDYLIMNGMNVILCQDGKKGWNRFINESFDLCILDVMMPEQDGFSLGKDIRKSNPRIPLVYLTAKGMREDQLKGFELGADDYILKPFDPEILLMKLKALLKRAGGGGDLEQEEFKIGDFVFSHSTRELRNGGEAFKLSPREADLLKLLALNKNQLLSRETALKAIWGDDSYFNGRSMDVFMTRLRKYFKGNNNITIENIHGNGYMLREG
jgi:two-component system, OmpR family, response regulator